MSPHRHRRPWAVLGIVVLLVMASFASETFDDHTLDGAFNLITFGPEGFGYGDATLSDGEHTGGTDTVIVTASGKVETGEHINFSKFFHEYVIYATGRIFGEAAHGEGHRDHEHDHGAWGMIARTGVSAAFFGLSLVEAEEHGHGHGLGARGLDGEHGHDEINILFAAVKQNSLETPALLGRAWGDTFVGAFLLHESGETTARRGLMALGRAYDSGLAIHSYDYVAAALTRRAGTLDAAAVNGAVVARMSLDASLHAGIPGGAFTETAAVYRVALAADTVFALVSRETAPTSAKRNFAGAAVRPRSPLTRSDIAGIWQMNFVISEEEHLHGNFATFDLVGDGTGFFENGSEDAFHAGPVSWSLGNETIDGGLSRAESVVVLAFRPEHGAETVTMRSFVSTDTRYLVGAGSNEGLFGLAARRANEVAVGFSFNTEKELLSQSNVEVRLKIATGATAGAPRFRASLLGSQDRLMSAFSRLRDSAVQALGVTTLRAGVTITPETTVLQPESVTITIGLTSSAGGLSLARGLHGDHSEPAAGSSAPGSTLTPLAFNAATGRWELVPSANIISRNADSVVFKAPHFSSFGVIAIPGTQSPEVKLCLATRLFGGTEAARLLPWLRTGRDRLLDWMPARILVSAYYEIGLLLAMIFGASILLARRYRLLALILGFALVTAPPKSAIHGAGGTAWLPAAAPVFAQAPEPDDEPTPVGATTSAPGAAPAPASTPSRGGFMPQLGFVIDGTFEWRSRGDDQARIRSAEIAIGAPVDPYFDLFGDILLTPDEVELEEAYATVHFSALLPGIPIVNRLQGRFGKMLIPFGHLGGTHIHDYPQVDPPRVMTEFFGGEAPNQTGGWVEYIVPFSANPTLSLLAGAYTGDYGRAFDRSSSKGPMWLLRATTFTEWGGRNALRLSGSWLDDRNDTQSGLHSRIWSIEAKYRRAFERKGRQIVLGGEYIQHDRNENARTLNQQNNGRNLTTKGAYLWGQYDHDAHWGVGYRYDVTHPLFSARNRTIAHSPYIEYRPTEFSKLRLQYSADDPLIGTRENRILLQGIWMIGWHPAHKF